MLTPIADFPFDQLGALSVEAGRFHHRTGLHATLTTAWAGECDGCMGEVIEITDGNGEVPALVYPVTDGIRFEVFPAGEGEVVATVAEALDGLAAVFEAERAQEAAEGEPVAPLPPAIGAPAKCLDPAVEFTVEELEAVLLWAEGGPFRATIATHHEELPEVAEFYRQGGAELAYRVVKLASGAVAVWKCQGDGRGCGDCAIVAEVPTALAWIEGRESGARGTSW